MLISQSLKANRHLLETCHQVTEVGGGFLYNGYHWTRAFAFCQAYWYARTTSLELLIEGKHTPLIMFQKKKHTVNLYLMR